MIGASEMGVQEELQNRAIEARFCYEESSNSSLGDFLVQHGGELVEALRAPAGLQGMSDERHAAILNDIVAIGLSLIGKEFSERGARNEFNKSFLKDAFEEHELVPEGYFSGNPPDFQNIRFEDAAAVRADAEGAAR